MVNAILMFPGQGAQRVGMGRDLAERFPEARQVFREVDDALDVALSRLMWEGPEDELTLTHNAQPALLAHSLAVHAVVRSLLRPVAGAGHSLGEYCVYTAAGSITVREAARLVRRRGELMLAAGKARPGTMAVVIGLPTDAVDAICREASSPESLVVPANINTPEQTVLSGDPDAVARATERCKAAGAKRALSLKVSGAFHSPLMESAREPFMEELEAVDIRDPAFPVISSSRAEVVRDAATARALLGEQIAAPVRWVDCMLTAHANRGSEATFVELGPGKVLVGLLRRIVHGASAMTFGTADDVEELLEKAV